MLSYLEKLYKIEAIASMTLMGIRGSSLVAKFLLALFVARYMDFESLGLYGLVGAACTIAPSVVGFSLMYTISRKIVDKSYEEINRELNYYLKCTSVIYLIALPLIIGFAAWHGHVIIYAIFFIIVLLEHLNQDFYNLLINLSKPLTANILHFLRTSLWMILFMGTAYFITDFRSIEGISMFWALGNIAPLLVFFWVAGKWPKETAPNKISLWSWFRSELSISKTSYATNLLRSVSQYLNQVLISIFLGLDLTGVYVFFAQIIGAMSNLLETGTLQIVRPQFIRAYTQHEQEIYWHLYRITLRNILLTATAMSIFAVPCMYFLVHDIVDKPLAIEWLYLFWWMLALFVFGNINKVNALVFYSQHRDDISLQLSYICYPPTLVVLPALIYFYSLPGAIAGSFIFSVLGTSLRFMSIKKLNLRYARSQPSTIHG